MRRTIPIWLMWVALSASVTSASEFGEWGFKGFEVPSRKIVLDSGGSIEDAVKSLRAQGGGTLRLKEGTYFANRIWVPSNVAIEGAGVGKTVIKSNGADEVLRPDIESVNIIFRSFTVDASANTGNGIDIAHGGDNILIEDIEVFGAKKGNIIVWSRDNEKHVSENVTVRRVKTHDARLYHGLAMRIVNQAAIIDVETWGNGGYGIDVSTSDFIEIGGSYVHENRYGTKFPQTNHLYMHDTRIEDNGDVGIKMKRMGAGKLYYHFENNVIKNSGLGAIEWMRGSAHPTFAEFVVRGNRFSGNVFNYFKIRSGNVYSFGDPIGTGPPNDKMNLVRHPFDETPASLNVGYTTW
jgi:hypothetical protein